MIDEVEYSTLGKIKLGKKKDGTYLWRVCKLNDNTLTYTKSPFSILKKIIHTEEYE